MKTTRVYDFTLTPGGSFPILAEGSFFRILTSTGPLDVQGDQFGTVGPIQAGQGLRDQPFKRLNLVDRSGSGNVGTIMVSDGLLIDDRITGEVSVIDGELSKSKVGAAFSGVGLVTSVAGQISYIELWNPSGSNKRVVLTDIIYSSNSNSVFILNKTSVQISAATIPQSKSSANHLPMARIGSGNLVTIPGVMVEAAVVSLNSPLVRVMKNPYILEPNSGILMHTGTMQVGLYGAFNFLEESIL